MTLRAAFFILPAVATWAGCGGGSSPSNSNPVPVPVPTPAPTPTPTPALATPCQLTAPKIDCATRSVRGLDMAGALQEAVDTAVRTSGVMYAEYTNRIHDLDQFRRIVVDTLTKTGICAAWDYGNERGDEIYLRSADGCVTEQYDLITGDGGVRPATASSNAWQHGFEQPVPPRKPDFPKEGDTSCSLPSDRSTFCFQIKGTRGQYGTEIYQVLADVSMENPALFDKTDVVGGLSGDFVPGELRLPGWRIVNQDGYIKAVESKLRTRGYCGFVYQGDILKVKKVSAGNLFHEEMDIVQNPAAGSSYQSYVIKDRCHNAGF